MTEKQLSRVAQFIDKRVNELAGKKSQREIAEQAGFPKPNIISMFKQGLTKVPIDRVLDLSRGLEVDPGYLFELALEQFYPDEQKSPMQQIFNGVIPTKAEAEILKMIRGASNGPLQSLDQEKTNKIREAISAIYG